MLNTEQLNSGPFEQLDVEIPATLAQRAGSIPLRLKPSLTATSANSFAYHPDNGHAPVMIGLSDIPVTVDLKDNHSPETAQRISIPCELSGQLADAGEQDWFSIDVQRGEVLHLGGIRPAYLVARGSADQHS